MANRIRACVNVQVEVPCASVWGSDTTVDQVLKQAIDDFQNTIRKINGQFGVGTVKVIEEPVPSIVILEPHRPKD